MAMFEIGSRAVDWFMLTFLTPGSPLSVSSLACAFFIAAGFLIWKRHKRGHETRIRVLFRALLPKRYFSKTARLDVMLLVFNACTFALVFGMAITTYNAVSAVVVSGLVSALGEASPTSLSALQTGAIMTFGVFMAFEFAYWLDHYLAHRIPFLWEFHRVHHEAEVLTPLTIARVHPVDTIVYYNINALCIGLTHGLLSYAFGETAHEFVLFDVNILIFIFMNLLTHLQHTHMWIAFTGMLGRIIMSPAHHQVHHSTNPKHFNKNLGGVLAVFDWLFGTLYIPSKTPEKLTFGVVPEAGETHAPHSLWGALIAPLDRVGKMLMAKIRMPRAPSSAASAHASPATSASYSSADARS